MATTVERLGTLYIAAADFRENAAVYGCRPAIDAMSETQIEEVIALASRMVDAHCAGQGFSPDVQITENHKIDMRDPRIRPNQPPVIDLLSLGIRTGPASFSPILLTPVSQDAGGNKVGFGAVYYNRQENVIELSGLLTIGGAVSAIFTLGLKDAQAELTYKNAVSVPKEVQAATAYQAALLANQAHLDNKVLPGVMSMATPELSITREHGQREGRTAQAMHPMAISLLKRPTAITIC